MKRKQFSDGIGLRLSRQALRVLRERGIFVQSSVRLEHQQLANRYVVRGLESGGAAGDIGRYVTFAQEEGRPIEYLYLVEAIGVNGGIRFWWRQCWSDLTWYAKGGHTSC